MRAAAIIIVALMASAVMAEAPFVSLRPVARPGSVRVITVPENLDRAAPFISLRPVARPRAINAVIAAEKPRRQARLTRAERREARRQRKLQTKGAVCGDRAIQGVAIGRVPGKIAGCGVKDAVRITSISGVALSQNAVMECPTAKALKTWINTGLQPAVRNKGGGVTRLRVVSHYACRTRNSRKGARISEHGKGRAIDIAAFQLRDGSEISVLKHWGRGSKGRILKRMHSSACGPFGTVLGPKSDRYHKDHFHFDTAHHRGGPYCR